MRLRVRLFSLFAHADMRMAAVIDDLERKFLTESEMEAVSDVRERIYNAWAAERNRRANEETS